MRAPDTTSDECGVNASQREDRFRRLYEEHYEALLAYALRRCDRVEAHDVVADTFLVLWRRLDEAPGDEEIPLWLYGVIRNVVANRYRSSRRRERLAARVAQIAYEEVATDELAADRLQTRQVLAALQQIGDADREILLLAAWEELSTAQIATVIGCTENAAAIRLHRARKRLTEVYKKENEGAGDIPGEWPRLRRPPRTRQNG
jgi:RNA polymerase sigma-70 factor (ECF subfamily)